MKNKIHFIDKVVAEQIEKDMIYCSESLFIRLNFRKMYKNNKTRTIIYSYLYSRKENVN